MRARVGAHLHDRGVLMLRFARGVSQEDLQAFVELLLQPGKQCAVDEGPRRIVDDDPIVVRCAGERGESVANRRRARCAAAA